MFISGFRSRGGGVGRGANEVPKFKKGQVQSVNECNSIYIM